MIGPGSRKSGTIARAAKSFLLYESQQSKPPRVHGHRPLRRCRSRRVFDSRGLQVPCAGDFRRERARNRLGRASRPPRRRRRSPASCPSRSSASPCTPANSRRAANHERDSSGVAAAGGIVDSPRTSYCKIGRLPRRAATPPFDPSPARFTWTRAGISSRRAAESVSREWTSSQIRFTTFTLLDCRRPMKCQRKASPYSACFASKTLSAVLADHCLSPAS